MSLTCYIIISDKANPIKDIDLMGDYVIFKTLEHITRKHGCHKVLLLPEVVWATAGASRFTPCALWAERRRRQSCSVKKFLRAAKSCFVA